MTKETKHSILAVALMAIGFLVMGTTFLFRIFPISSGSTEVIPVSGNPNQPAAEVHHHATYLIPSNWIPLTGLGCAIAGAILWARVDKTRPRRE
jgi:hypothetical protein